LAIANGLLQDSFVFAQHRGAFDRDLLRLLMDGYVLVACGVVYTIWN